MIRLLASCCLLIICNLGVAQVATWPQWRGPGRDGLVPGADWPDSLSEDRLKRLWRVELPPS